MMAAAGGSIFRYDACREGRNDKRTTEKLPQTKTGRHLGGDPHHGGDLFPLRLSSAAPEVGFMGPVSVQYYLPHCESHQTGDAG